MTRPPLRLIGIAASAGGIQPLIDLLAGLPADLPHAVCVTVHVSASAKSMLPEILDRHCALTVTPARHGARLAAGCVFVAPPDRHLVVADGSIELSRGPKENGVRPAADVMLRSIARHGGRGVAVVLSGALGDGGIGARHVLRAGGAVFVQDPEEAAVSSMPERALELLGGAARVLTAPEIGQALAALGSEDGDHRRRIGHAYGEDAMAAGQGKAVESALRAALEVLEERGELLRRVAGRRGTSAGLRDRLTAAAGDADERAELVRRALAVGEPAAPE